MTGCVVVRGGTAEEEEDPWREDGSRRVEGAASGEHSEDEELDHEEVHRVENEEGTSSPEVEVPTLEAN